MQTFAYYKITTSTYFLPYYNHTSANLHTTTPIQQQLKRCYNEYYKSQKLITKIGKDTQKVKFSALKGLVFFLNVTGRSQYS